MLAWLGIEPTTLDLSSRSASFDQFANTTRDAIVYLRQRKRSADLTDFGVALDFLLPLAPEHLICS